MLARRRISTAALALALAACSGDGDADTSEDDSAPVSAPGGPTTTVTTLAPAMPDDVADGAWAVGEQFCEPPPADDDTPLIDAVFVSPADVRPGDAIEVALDADAVAAAAGIDPADVETYGGNFVLLTCWADGGWNPVWLVRLPGFGPIEDDPEADADDLGGDEEIEEAGAVDDGGSYALGLNVAIAGVDITEPFAVETNVPADVPPGTYRWTTAVGIAGSNARVTLTQLVEITS